MADKASKKNKSKDKKKSKRDTKAKLNHKRDKPKKPKGEKKKDSKKSDSKSPKLKKKDLKKKDRKKHNIHPSDEVLVKETDCGFGVFAKRDYPTGAIVGEITGTMIIDEDYGSDYCLHLGGPRHLEPTAPFRFLNHSCEANCEFDWIVGRDKHDVRVYVSTLQEIYEGEQLTIDYNWPADSAIPCLCGTESCRGWVVCLEEIHLVEGYQKSKKRMAS